MELADQHMWWKHQGGQELRRFLMEQWDPIGVKSAPEAADEYDGYRGRIVELLRAGTPPSELAGHLAEFEQQMGLTARPEHLLPVAQELARWYPDSLERWEASHPRR
jgi:hypothetical protein